MNISVNNNIGSKTDSISVKKARSGDKFSAILEASGNKGSVTKVPVELNVVDHNSCKVKVSNSHGSFEKNFTVLKENELIPISALGNMAYLFGKLRGSVKIKDITKL